MRIAGLIVAAGMSTRMNDFKPLMKINGFPMINMTAQSLRNGGVEDILVVVGYRAEDIKKALDPMEVRFAENAAYASTDMLESIRIGLKELKDMDAVYIMPGDMPLVSPEIMRVIRKEADKIFSGKEDIQIIVPQILKKPSHPLVLLKSGFDLVLNGETQNGMKGLINILKSKWVPLNEDKRQPDADTKQEFESIEDQARRTKGVSDGICEELYEQKELPGHIRRHCRAVGNLAAGMAEQLIGCGACLDVELCRSAGYLHDICKPEPEHEKAAGDFLRGMGYERLAETVEGHRGFSEMPSSLFDEKVIVTLADKLVKEDKRVTLEERYSKAFSMPYIKPWILKTIEICSSLLKKYKEITGTDLEKGEPEA
jgi:molybdenum cofactor cytidylyltransferase